MNVLPDFIKAPIVGILRGFDLATCHQIAEAYQNAGLKYLEITMNTKGVEEIIASLVAKFPSLKIGAGTVCTMDDYKKAINAGASFIVTPIIDLAVIRKAVDMGIPIFPGAYTPTEIFQAWSAGATAVKVFPAGALGSSYIKDVLGPLNEIKLLPTGGVSKENIKEFLQAGAVGAGMGGTLFPKELIHDKNWTKLEEHFKSVLSAAT
ncbi:bifunctional 4-hydroxy-2-oxoglutarate aldolase/2-dehydro-3-deoxy-phosphogluconate aldolase [Arcticibacterium luteifluviistationis]|uniref:2-dehydro-3-deoxyphosphogluconate aldolase n=1 Tax=Arcticibacterium luteifluviistationis TaxID=1784714 RepID=A0A2Z4G6H2_9BACT|nr:bifunctional 4-hydroxy-2-oxoglutarate aldolase/2-dehydro-3-deoxy-phosphogluconate aldolase [Arcticibacterium luteifluviistationis]AWV96746.1 2-dehydro-3-deoxyphosphogluconate aldolase [Arcticibacterium luteifluviistationis]